MAEEKKPKIDLKARLGKTGVGGVTPPPAGVGVPAPAPSGGTGLGSIPSPGPGGNAGLPMPLGVPVGPPPSFGNSSARSLDPSNPLSAAVAPYRAPTAPTPSTPVQAQRIEVDELTVQQARKGGWKQGLVAGLAAAVVVGIIGYIAGGAIETSRARAKAVNDAKGLATDVQKSREQLKLIADKVEAGRNSLLKDKKFPESLGKDLGGINVDFDGNKLAGVRFSGFPRETTSALIEYVTNVQTLNDRKTAINSLLSRLQKPITEQLTAGPKTSINYVVFFGTQDPSKNPFALLAPLTKPIEAANAGQITLPAEFTATDPITRQNIKAPKYTTGNLDKPSAVYVLPKSVEAACPSETAGAIAQLGNQLGRVLTDIRGETAAPASADVVPDNKPGLLDRADKLVASLNRVE